MLQIKKYVPKPVKRFLRGAAHQIHHPGDPNAFSVRKSSIVKDQKAKPNKERFLLFALLNRDLPLSTVEETVSELIGHSSYPIDYVNVWPSASLARDFEFYHYDGIIIHNSVQFIIETLINLDANCRQKLADFKGMKIMFKQDENYRQNRLIDYLEQNPFDLVTTLADPAYLDAFYPPERLPNLSLIQYLTGYVKESHKSLPYRDIRNRGVDVGYRGSIQPASVGLGGYEKRQIGWEFEKHAKARGLVTDISSRWEDRFFGENWLRFMGNCKAILGVESGANIADLDGSVERDYEAFIAANPGATDEMTLAHLAKYESPPLYRAISPRHFEAAACFAVQVMYEGRFQGIFKKDVHYIALNRDFSNVNEVIDRLLDEKERERITNNAYSDIILNEKYGYEHFVKRFDAAVKRLGAGKQPRIIFI